MPFFLTGAADAICSRSESKWQKADDYAVLSMAQTRATSKALRLPLGFVMTLAGFDPTPAEEMTTSHPLTDEPETVNLSDKMATGILQLQPEDLGQLPVDDQVQALNGDMAAEQALVNALHRMPGAADAAWTARPETRMVIEFERLMAIGAPMLPGFEVV